MRGKSNVIDESPMGKKRALLYKHEADIKELRERGYSLRQIVEWLEERNVVVSSTALNNFIKSM